ncbi:MAG: dihydropyrimidinase [Oscillospiraceae bacterium]|jgi:dihydropyrimidinase|nr:dihydropyrimidinase [Oscillospiraceae bacterium]
MKKILKGGCVVNACGSRYADVLIDGEKVVRVAEDIVCENADVIDVRGKLLFPGFIDAHTHFDLDVSNTTTADDFYTGGRAALRGGTTMVIDFACPNKGESLQYGLELWHKKASGKTACDYSFHMTIDDWSEENIAQLPRMFEQGVSSFKMYMTYPAMMIGDEAIFRALQKMRELGGIAGVHCENAGVIDALIAQKKEAGEFSPAAHPQCRPSILEAEAVGRLLKIAQVADVPVVIVHLTCEDALREVQAARARGQKVYVETCPHYLLLDDSRYSRPNFEGAKYVCAPPLRKKSDNARLWDALAQGEIQTVATDHCSFTLKQKDAGREDFTKIPGGMPGVETRGVLLYSYGVAENKLSAEKMVDLLSTAPAKLYGAFPRKGQIAEGADADIVVYDPSVNGVISAETQAANVDYNPFEGFGTVGEIAQVYLRGVLAVDHGAVLHDRDGVFIPRGKCAL